MFHHLRFWRTRHQLLSTEAPLTCLCGGGGYDAIGRVQSFEIRIIFLLFLSMLFLFYASYSLHTKIYTQYSVNKIMYVRDVAKVPRHCLIHRGSANSSPHPFDSMVLPNGMSHCQGSRTEYSFPQTSWSWAEARVTRVFVDP